MDQKSCSTQNFAIVKKMNLQKDFWKPMLTMICLDPIPCFAILELP